MTDKMSPAELATFDQHWQAVGRSVDQLVSSFREATGDGTTQRELDLILFASALTETNDPDDLGALLACAVARIASTSDRPDPVEALRAAYWKLRGHASSYRGTDLFRRRQEFFRTDPDNAVAARGAARDEWFARGIEAGADDFAELLATEYEAEIERDPDAEP